MYMVHGIKKDNQFANTLEDSITQRRAPNRLLSDRGQAIISNKASRRYPLYILHW
jgi:hypothetical protein